MFAYCNSNPVNMSDAEGLKPGDEFSDPDDAAEDFAETYNKKSKESDSEYASFIYKYQRYLIDWEITIFGKTYPIRMWSVKRYSYTEPKCGKPGQPIHFPFNEAPSSTVAVVHTHGAMGVHPLDKEIFSGEDAEYALNNKVDIYMVTPLDNILVMPHEDVMDIRRLPK